MERDDKHLNEWAAAKVAALIARCTITADEVVWWLNDLLGDEL